MNDYYKYINLRSKLNSLNDRHRLKHRDEKILDHIAHSTKDGDFLMVTDLINNELLGSPATIHARLTYLVQEDFVQRQTQAGSGRAKSLTLGKKGKARAKEICRVVSSF
jgi:DNA-binding MarR family transcriptional regulator